jgi:SAM-dependent methyltransferase
MSLQEAWEANAELWLRWARQPGFDSYEQFHRRRFLEIVPRPGSFTIDVGAGEGRLARDLSALGHRVVALDSSPGLARACAAHPAGVPTVIADGAAVPFLSRCADLVVAFMSLQDIDAYATAITEASGLLRSGGRLCLAIVHPVNSAGSFEGGRDDSEAPFVIRGSYMDTFRYHDHIERDGLTMNFHSAHRPLEAYFAALEAAGLLVETLREVTVEDPQDRWYRIPGFVHLRALRQ